MTSEQTPTQQHVDELIHRLRSPAPWVRKSAAEELAKVDFEQLERPPQLSLLLAAMNAPDLRDRARDSLARVLRGMAHGELDALGPEERKDLRSAIKLSRPQTHADFLVEASNVLLRIHDTEAIPVLDKLVERSTIRQYVAEEYRKGQGTTYHLKRSFEGTPAEEHEVRRVRSAAHVASERLRLIAETAAPGRTLLHAAMPPQDEELLRPAGSIQSEPDRLPRPDPRDKA